MSEQTGSRLSAALDSASALAEALIAHAALTRLREDRHMLLPPFARSGHGACLLAQGSRISGKASRVARGRWSSRTVRLRATTLGPPADLRALSRALAASSAPSGAGIPTQQSWRLLAFGDRYTVTEMLVPDERTLTLTPKDCSDPIELNVFDPPRRIAMAMYNPRRVDPRLRARLDALASTLACPCASRKNTISGDVRRALQGHLRRDLRDRVQGRLRGRRPTSIA